MEPNDLYKRITQACRMRKITIRELANRVGINEGTIKNWKYVKPYGQTISVVATELNVSMDYLYSLTPIPDINLDCSLSEPIMAVVRVAKELDITTETANVLINVMQSINKEFGK